MKLYTIGFVKKNAEDFFNILKKNHIKTLIDTRVNNKSQLAGFTKQDDLRYFLTTITCINYVHKPEYAPTKVLLKDYREKKVTWQEYEKIYINLLEERKILEDIDYLQFDKACFLCSEATADKCHRRLLAEYLQKSNGKITVIHL